MLFLLLAGWLVGWLFIYFRMFTERICFSGENGSNNTIIAAGGGINNKTGQFFVCADFADWMNFKLNDLRLENHLMMESDFHSRSRWNQSEIFNVSMYGIWLIDKVPAKRHNKHDNSKWWGTLYREKKSKIFHSLWKKCARNIMLLFVLFWWACFCFCSVDIATWAYKGKQKEGFSILKVRDTDRHFEKLSKQCKTISCHVEMIESGESAHKGNRQMWNIYRSILEIESSRAELQKIKRHKCTVAH